MAVRVWRVSWPMTIAPPTKTKRTRKASAMPSVICHSWPTRLWAVTFGVASRVWPSRVRIGSRAEVTRSRNQSSMAASMWPVMSNRPGEGWLPPLTLPPLPGAGVVGVVVLPGADLDARWPLARARVARWSWWSSAMAAVRVRGEHDAPTAASVPMRERGAVA